MNYELAQQLQDAGWPQPEAISVGQGIYIAPPDRDLSRFEKKLYAPSLAELIEACGTFVGLDRFDQGWKATGVITDLLISRDGTTPEEAVAKLWLVLNPK